MSRRVLTAAAGIPLLLALAYLGDWFWLGAVVLLHGLATAEARSMGPGLVGELPPGLLYAAVPLFELFAYWRGPQGYAEALLALFAATAVIYVVCYPRHSLVLWAAGLVVSAYLGLFSFLVLLERSGGWPHLWLLLFVVWANDTVAYLAGSRFGRRPLAPLVSPHKTWEGAIAGLAASVAVGMAAGGWLCALWIQGALVGLLLSVAGQIGDLWESALKRQAGVKDAGRLLPGHGGVLDRFDSLLFAAPVAFYLLLAMKL